jgi:hypothetical protein
MTLLLAIIGHLVGDYLLQNDWMAMHKKEFPVRCSIHAIIWSLCVVLFSGWWNSVHGWKGCLLGFILVTTHYIQDRTNIISWWMDLIGQNQFRTGPCAPWSTIVVDNVWHIVTIWAVWRFLT